MVLCCTDEWLVCTCECGIKQTEELFDLFDSTGSKFVSCLHRTTYSEFMFMCRCVESPNAHVCVCVFVCKRTNINRKSKTSVAHWEGRVTYHGDILFSRLLVFLSCVARICIGILSRVSLSVSVTC